MRRKRKIEEKNAGRSGTTEEIGWEKWREREEVKEGKGEMSTVGMRRPGGLSLQLHRLAYMTWGGGGYLRPPPQHKHAHLDR